MSVNDIYPVRPHASQDKLRIAAGSPLAIQGLFLEILRERFREDAGINLVWREDITETDILVEVAYNEETEARNAVPALYVNRLQTIPSRTIIGDRVGVRLPDHLEGFGAIATTSLAISCVSNDAGQSAQLGDLVQFMLLASQDIIQKEYGLYDMSHPSLGQTMPFTQDQLKWNTPVEFSIQYWIRWSQVQIKPLLQQIAQRVTSNGVDASGSQHFVNVTVNSLNRGDVLDSGSVPTGAPLPPSRVSVVGPPGPQGLRGLAGTAGAPGAAGPAGVDAPTRLTIRNSAATTETLSDTDNGSIIRYSSPLAITVTVPATLTLGTSVVLEQANTGTVSVVGSGTLTLEVTASAALPPATLDRGSVIAITLVDDTAGAEIALVVGHLG